jgi:hypothetical protein
MYEDYAKTTEWTNTNIWMHQTNQNRMREFLQKVDNWKLNAVQASSQLARERGIKFPPRPEVPTEQTVDRAKFDAYWEELNNNPGPREKDYYVEKPIVLSESFWEIFPPNPQPKTNVNRPVGAKDPGAGKGFFENVGGPSFRAGDKWTDPDTDIEYRLVEFRTLASSVGVNANKWALIGVAKVDGVPVQ